MTFEPGDNEWETGSGLALANIDVEVVAAAFGFNVNLGADVLCANFTFLPVEGGESIEQSFSVGKGWETADKGDVLVSDNGKARKVNNSTNYGRLIDSAVAAVHASGSEEMPFSSPRQASGWVGTKWHVGTVQVTTTNPTTKKEAVKDAFVFEAFLGKGDGPDTTGKASGGSKPAASGGLDEKLRKKLLKLAMASDDHDEFVQSATELSEVQGNAAAEKAVLAKDEGSIWAEAND